MLDKSFTKAEKDNDSYLVQARYEKNFTLIKAKLSLCKQNKFEYRIVASIKNYEGLGEDYYAALQDLQLQFSNIKCTLCCCGNCRYIQLTGLSRQMSSGIGGYCLVNMEKYGRSLNDAVSIFDCCDLFEYGPQEYIKEFNNRY